jgi:hypothetical protein
VREPLATNKVGGFIQTYYAERVVDNVKRTNPFEKPWKIFCFLRCQ